jgi:tetratricopeptide (TPR) repeat protein
MPTSRTTLLASVTMLLLVVSPARPQSEADTKLFQKVMDRLLSTDNVKRAYPEEYAWPPKYFVKPKSAKEVNAYASAHPGWGAETDKKSGKLRPIVCATEGILREVIKGDEDSLAVIMGHELAHLTRGHCAKRKGETALLLLAFNRDNEIEADLEGLRYALAAGYPYKLGVTKAIQAMRARDDGATSFEGLSSTHPTWEDRLIFLDRDQAKLWSSMSAFHNGQLFLELEQYPAAKQCFKAVVGEFPDCYEAWANLGYAQLMQYCDGLNGADVRSYKIGQIVTGGFYTRPASLQAKVRGIDDKLWQDAVKSLRKALAIKADLALPNASLGVAYLVHPEGKDAKAASKWLGSAVDLLHKDAGLKKNPQALAAVLVNAAVADLASNQAAAARDKLKEALALAQRAEYTPMVRSIEEAILYNSALIDAGATDTKRKKHACELLELYLRRGSPGSAWWPLAHAQHTKLAGELGVPALDGDELAKGDSLGALRTVVSVAVGKDAVTLSEPLAAAVARLGGEGAGVATPVYRGASIVRWRFAAHGIDLLGKDRVLAIFLTDIKAPPVAVRAAGPAAKRRQLRVGMTSAEAKELLKDQRADFAPRPIDDPEVEYVCYPELGLALRYRFNRVMEIAIAQVPRVSLAKE